jgi:hypothetical protein
MKEIIRNINGVAGRTVTVTGLAEPTMTRDNVLGILNGTQNEVLYVPMFYGDIDNVTYSNGTLTITLAATVPAIANGDKLFVKLYTDADGYALETSVKDGNDTAISVAKAIQQAVGTAPAGSQMATTFAYLASIYESIVGTVSPDVPEGVADRLAAVMKFFGIYVDGDKVYVRGADPEHSEQIVPAEFMTDTEVCGELEDIMRVIDPNLTAEQAAAITAQTLNPSES